MKFISSILILLLSASQVLAEVRFESKKLADNIYTVYGAGGFTGGNHLLINGKDGVILVDTSMPDYADMLVETIDDLVDEDEVDFLINTHLHADHVANNGFFADEGATIIAHQGTYDTLKNKGLVSGGGVSEAADNMLPHIVFGQSMNLYLNGLKLELSHIPNAHTLSDIIVHIPELNMIHVGDMLFNGIFPFIDLNNGGDVDGYIAGQKHILNIIDDDTKVVAGHGPFASKSDLKNAYDMLVDARAIIAKHKKQGKSEDEVVEANPLKKYHDDWNWGFITTERMTRQVYRGL